LLPVCVQSKAKAVGTSSTTEKEKNNGRKTDNRNYKHYDRQTVSGSAVPNDTNYARHTAHNFDSTLVRRPANVGIYWILL
jgi:hypothetical protein